MKNNFYYDVYNARLNRYGNDYQSRVQGQRQKVFEQYLLKSIYQIEFDYEDEVRLGTLEPYKQDETETLHYLLTDLDVKLKPGTILEIAKLRVDFEEPEYNYWMVYWQEQKQAAGYNKYVMLKMSHEITWRDNDGNIQTIRAYFYGQEDNMLKDELKSRSRNHALYEENLKLSFFITPFNSKIQKDNYFEITTGEGDNQLKQAFVVTGYDVISTEGVEYVSVDPQYIRDLTPMPEKKETDDDKDYYWLQGGDI